MTSSVDVVDWESVYPPPLSTIVNFKRIKDF